MEILIPIYWFSDSLVESHHKQASHSAHHLLLAPICFPFEVHRVPSLLYDLPYEDSALIRSCKSLQQCSSGSWDPPGLWAPDRTKEGLPV